MRVCTIVAVVLQVGLCCALSALPSAPSSSRRSLLNPKYDLVIWDCDGVLVDSEALLKQGEVEALAAAGFTGLTEMDCIRLFSGFSPDAAADNFLREMMVPLPANFIRDQIAGSMDLFRRRLAPLMTTTVLALHNDKVPMCVASGSPRDRVLLCLEVGGTKPCFPDDRVFTRELVKRGKPAPDLFLYAAEKMGVPASRCIVVEDSSSGVEAAMAAGMACVAYLGGGHAKYDWYQTKMKEYGTPIGYTQEDVLRLLG